jgi:hypothetical protein
MENTQKDVLQVSSVLMLLLVPIRNQQFKFLKMSLFFLLKIHEKLYMIECRSFPLNYTRMDILSLVLPLVLCKVVKILLDTNKMCRRKSLHYYFKDVSDRYMLNILKIFYHLHRCLHILKIFRMFKFLSLVCISFFIYWAKLFFLFFFLFCLQHFLFL